MAGLRELYKIDHTSKVFGGSYIFNDISLSIKQGEILGIIGGSGSGKTTLLNLLVGFLKPERGDIMFMDTQILQGSENSLRSVYKNQKHLKSMYGFASQVPSFYPNLTVFENLRYFGTLYNLSKESIQANSDHLLELMDLNYAKKTLAKKLSGGMKRRLDIACSLIHDPKILILDEPTADLDPVLSHKIWELIKEINQRGTTVIVATHDLSNLEGVATRIAIIKNSSIAAIGKPSEIKLRNACHEKINLKSSPGNYKRIVSKLKKSDKSISSNIKQYEIRDKSLIIHVKKSSDIVPHVLRTIEQLNEKLVDVEFIKPSLDHVFKKITASKLYKEPAKKRSRKKK
jgi:ABC-2 type transport system ATP-binding protein